MKQLEFESNHAQFWTDFEALLDDLNKGEEKSHTHFPLYYRTICQHHAIAKSRGYANGLTARLNSLAQRGYQRMYGDNFKNKGAFLDFIFYGFPAVLRANKGYLWAAFAVFVLPAVVMFISCLVNDQIIYSLIDPSQVRELESMYDPEARKFGRERQSDTDLMMFGFYIYNNISVSFRSFSTGIFFGIGSLFFMGFNGLYLGGVAGHLTSLGYNETFYPFVIGHGSFELTAIVFSGAAGLKIGYALLAPGANTRLKSLQYAASDAIKIIYGVIVMLLIAAFIEAFWSSSSTLPIPIKLAVGGFLWVLVMYYCFFFRRADVTSINNNYAAE